jgi:hypothetical protein
LINPSNVFSVQRRKFKQNGQTDVQTSANKTGSWTGFRGWFFKSKPKLQADVAPVSVTVTRAPVDPLELRKRQWKRLAEMIDAGTSTTLSVQQVQRSAGQRIDAAGYALDGLRAELSAAMTAFAAPAPTEIRASRVADLGSLRPLPSSEDQSPAAAKDQPMAA